MTEGQVYAARRNPATPVDQNAHNSPDWYLDFAYSEVRALAAAGKLGDERTVTVRTGLDERFADEDRDRHRDDAARQGAGISRPSGGGRDRDDRRTGAGNRRRTRLWREPVQSGDRRRAPARLVIQDFRLYDRAFDRQIPRRDADRRVERLHRRLLRAQLSRRKRRRHSALHGAGRITQYRRDPHVDQDRRSLLAAEAELSPRQDRSARALQDRRDGARNGNDDAARRHGVAASGGGRGQDDRHGRRQRHAGRRRRSRHALRGGRGSQLKRKADLHPRDRQRVNRSACFRPTRSPK